MLLHKMIIELFDMLVITHFMFVELQHVLLTTSVQCITLLLLYYCYLCIQYTYSTYIHYTSLVAHIRSHVRHVGCSDSWNLRISCLTSCSYYYSLLITTAQHYVTLLLLYYYYLCIQYTYTITLLLLSTTNIYFDMLFELLDKMIIKLFDKLVITYFMLFELLD